ncbi:hypothetical protein PS2_021030 [Malus domestica]
MEDRRFLRFFSISLCIGLVLPDTSHHPLNPLSLYGDTEAYGSENQEKSAPFAKTLTQYDSNNGGRFSVPRYCAETIFPKLDYSADPPVQTVISKDVHAEVWKFKHIYRGTPRPHLLTTGWSTFVNQKKLVAGDSIVFLRAENGDLCVGIRRAKRGLDGGGGNEVASGWNNSHNSGGGSGGCVLPYGRFCVFLREEDNKMRNGGGGLGPNGNMRGKGRVRHETVVEAATLAANGQPFEVVYYPRASTLVLLGENPDSKTIPGLDSGDLERWVLWGIHWRVGWRKNKEVGEV